MSSARWERTALERADATVVQGILHCCLGTTTLVCKVHCIVCGMTLLWYNDTGVCVWYIALLYVIWHCGLWHCRLWYNHWCVWYTALLYAVWHYCMWYNHTGMCMVHCTVVCDMTLWCDIALCGTITLVYVVHCIVVCGMTLLYVILWHWCV